MNNLIGEKIRSIRMQKGLSQESIALDLSLSQSAYAKIEKGVTKIDIQRFLKIAELLETDPWDLLQLNDGKVINFNNSQLTNGYIENFYAAQKELYEQQIMSLQEEVNFLKKIIDKKL